MIVSFSSHFFIDQIKVPSSVCSCLISVVIFFADYLAIIVILQISLEKYQ